MIDYWILRMSDREHRRRNSHEIEDFGIDTTSICSLVVVVILDMNCISHWICSVLGISVIWCTDLEL